MTRNGIEIVPTISVTFRVNTGIPQKGQFGSRFGYRTGVTPKDKKAEKDDQEAIRKAILGEGINPNYSNENPRRRIAWNQLPAALAVDLWREYASKFTLDEFFTPGQRVPPAQPPIIEPTEEEIDPLTQAIQVGPSHDTIQISIARILRQINLWIVRRTEQLENKGNLTSSADKPRPYTTPSAPLKNQMELKTAIELINTMVKARLTFQLVDYLDDTEKRIDGHPQVKSREFELLKRSWAESFEREHQQCTPESRDR